MHISAENELLRFEGVFSEETNYDDIFVTLSNVTLREGNRLTLDLSGVSRCNSVGMMNLVRILKKLGKPVTFINAPIWLVEQLNMLATAFSDVDLHLESFLAEFYDTESGSSVLKVLRPGKDFPLLEDYDGFEMQLPEEDNKLEPGFEPASYFYFLTVLRH